MEDESIRTGAEFVRVACVFAIFGLGMIAPFKRTILDVFVLVLGVAVPICLVFMAWTALICDRRERDKRLREGIALTLVMEEGMSNHDSPVVSGDDKKKPIKVGERQVDGYRMARDCKSQSIGSALLSSLQDDTRHCPPDITSWPDLAR